MPETWRYRGETIDGEQIAFLEGKYPIVCQEVGALAHGTNDLPRTRRTRPRMHGVHIVPCLVEGGP